MIDPQILMPSKATKSAPPISGATITSEQDLGDDSDDVDLNEEEPENATYLIDIVTGITHDSDSIITDMPEMEQADLFDSLEDNLQANAETDPVHCSPEQFITNLSKINVIRNENMGGFAEAKFEELAGTYVATGNSRDVPSRFVFFCPNEAWGCEYKTLSNKKMKEHARKCKISEANPVKLAIFKGRKPSCASGSFKDESTRNRHEARS